MSYVFLNVKIVGTLVHPDQGSLQADIDKIVHHFVQREKEISQIVVHEGVNISGVDTTLLNKHGVTLVRNTDFVITYPHQYIVR